MDDMTAMTPDQEAAYAIACGLGREGLSPAALAIYDRLKGPPKPSAATAATRGTNWAYPATGTALATRTETLEQRYLRQTRTAVVFIAVVVGVVCALALAAAIVTGVQLAKMSTELSNLNGAATSSGCLSQGGSNPNC